MTTSKTKLFAAAAVAAFTAFTAFSGPAFAQDQEQPPEEVSADPPMQPIPNCPVPSGPCLSASTRWNGATEIREEDRRFHVNGRFMYDVAYTDADYSNQAGGAFKEGVRSYARRAFLGVDGRLTEQWRYNVKLDFTFGNGGGTAPNQAVQVKADDLYLEYALPSASFYIGNHNFVAPMEDRDSSLATPFNERSFLITAAGFGKKPGVAYMQSGGNWSAGIALQSNDGAERADNAAQGSEAGIVIARGTFDPIYSRTPDGMTLLHLGVTARYRDGGSAASGGSTGLSYSPGALSNKANNNAGTNTFGQDVYYGGEFAFQYNAFGLDGEYGHFDTGRGVDASADGYYVSAFWSLTGEPRNYNALDGSFRNVVPFRTFLSDGGFGHVMLSARYEALDLSDTAFGANANEISAYTLGLTVVPLDHIKVQLNYSSTDIDYVTNVAGTRVDNTIKALTLRTQFDW